MKPFGYTKKGQLEVNQKFFRYPLKSDFDFKVTCGLVKHLTALKSLNLLGNDLNLDIWWPTFSEKITKNSILNQLQFP